MREEEQKGRRVMAAHEGKGDVQGARWMTVAWYIVSSMNLEHQ